jgi:hypothetical protein
MTGRDAFMDTQSQATSILAKMLGKGKIIKDAIIAAMAAC